MTWQTSPAPFLDGGASQILGITRLNIEEPALRVANPRRRDGRGVIVLRDGQTQNSASASAPRWPIPQSQAMARCLQRGRHKNLYARVSTRIAYQQTGYEHQDSFKDDAGSRPHCTQSAKSPRNLSHGRPVHEAALPHHSPVRDTDRACLHFLPNRRTHHDHAPHRPNVSTTKPVCFGRFVMDVPASANVVLGSQAFGPDIESLPNDVKSLPAGPKPNEM